MKLFLERYWYPEATNYINISCFMTQKARGIDGLDDGSVLERGLPTGSLLLDH